MTSTISYSENIGQFSIQEIINFYKISTEKFLKESKESELIALIEKADYILFAICNDQIVGIIRAISDGKSANFIDDLRVHPNYRRLGLGKELLLRMEQSLSHIDKHYLMTEGKAEQQYFYESQGYVKQIDQSEVLINNFEKVVPH